MKARLHTKVLVATLLFGLLLSQVGAGFFHNKHDAHKGTALLGAGQYAVQQHGEHCKLCSIDLIHLFKESFEVQIASAQTQSGFVLAIAGNPLTFHSFSRGRAPPVC